VATGARAVHQDGVTSRRHGAGPRGPQVMSIWDVALALLPTLVILAAAIVLIEHLRVKGAGERYQHREYRADEEPIQGNGASSNRRTRQRKAKRARSRWKDWLP
jgi:hypothetical protein